MLQLSLLLALAVLLVGHAQADVAGDLVTALPGYATKLKSRHWSGFLPADEAQTVFLHYWYVEKEGGPNTSPVVLWLNGGPGCSSLDGFLSELGPLHFSGKRVNGLPEVIDNPYSWSTVANVLFLESPAGVGFSYTKNGSTLTNDEITSQNNYGFLKSFFKAYPEIADNEFYVTGESYAGIYTPTLGQRIWEGIKAGDKVNFKGIAAGNGCIGNEIGTCAMYDGAWEGVGIEMEFLHNHAMISEPHWQGIVKACGNFTDKNPSSACIMAANVASNDGGDYNIYDIYDTCADPVSMANTRHGQVSRLSTAYTEFLRKNNRVVPTTISPLTPDVCTGAEPAVWLNNVDVQKALHVDAVHARWAICAGVPYRKTLGSALNSYRTLVDNGYRVLIYSGDVDACVPHVGTERWTSQLGYKQVRAWQPWTINSQVAGYVVQYDRNFTYLTVKGAGHMVPQYRPAEALVMLERYIGGGHF